MIIMPNRKFTPEEQRTGALQTAIIMTFIAGVLWVLNLPVAAAIIGIISGLFWLLWLLIKIFQPH